MKNNFIAVDLWQKEFGTISVKAVFEIYARTFHVRKENISKLVFSHCVEALRKLEKPDYVTYKEKELLTKKNKG